MLPLIPSCARIVVETMKLLLTQLKDSPAAQTICCHVAASVLSHVRDALRLLAGLEGSGPVELRDVTRRPLAPARVPPCPCRAPARALPVLQDRGASTDPRRGGAAPAGAVGPVPRAVGLALRGAFASLL